MAFLGFGKKKPDPMPRPAQPEQNDDGVDIEIIDDSKEILPGSDVPEEDVMSDDEIALLALQVEDGSIWVDPKKRQK